MSKFKRRPAPKGSFKIHMGGLDKFRKQLDNAPRKVRTSSLRNALRATGRIARKGLKQQVKTLRKLSNQSTGATHRSIIYKAKTKDERGYMRAGIEYHYYERHMKTTPLYKIAGRQSKTKRRYIGYKSFKRKGRGGHKNVVKGFVASYQRRSLRIKRGTNFQANQPGKYWHLIEKGFKHFSGTVFPGHHFLKKVRLVHQAKMLSKFDQIILKSLNESLRS